MIRAGFGLLVAGTLLLGVSLILLIAYGGIGTATIPFLALAASFATLGTAATLLALAGGRFMPNRGVRAGLSLLAIGLLAGAGFMFGTAFMGIDPMRSPVLLLGAIGYLAIPAGALLATIAGVLHAVSGRRSARR